MDSKAIFKQLVNAGPSAQSEDFIDTILSTILRDSQLLDLFEKPAVQRLLASSMMRDAVQAVDVPVITELYDQIYHASIATTKQSISDWVQLTSLYLIPILLIVCIAGFLFYAIVSRLSSREQAREEKKRLKQLKKQNAELQRKMGQKSKSF